MVANRSISYGWRSGQHVKSAAYMADQQLAMRSAGVVHALDHRLYSLIMFDVARRLFSAMEIDRGDNPAAATFR